MIKLHCSEPIKTTQVSTLSFGDTGLLVYVTGLEGNWPQMGKQKWKTKSFDPIISPHRWQAKGDQEENPSKADIPQEVNCDDQWLSVRDKQSKQ